MEYNNKQSEWYYKKNGKQIGPVSEDEIKASIETGFLSYGSMVLEQGAPGWGKLGDSALKHLVLGAEQQFEKIDIVLMIIFTIITAGIYPAIWFLRRMDVINSLQSKDKLNIRVFVFVIVIASIGLLLPFIVGTPWRLLFHLNYISKIYGLGYHLWGEGIYEMDQYIVEAIHMFSISLNLTAIIILVFQCFKVRNIFNEHFNMPRRNISFSEVATFFFGIFYLQYEINRF